MLSNAEAVLREKVLARAFEDFTVTRVGWFFMPMPPGPTGKLEPHHLGTGSYRLH